MPPTVTTTLPVVAPVGTVATIDVELQLATVVVTVSLNATVLLPWLEPKPVPPIVTWEPTTPEVGDRPVTFGTTVKGTPLLTAPPTLTITFPMPPVAPVGIVTVIEVVLQFAATAGVPLTSTELAPCDAPNPVPVIVSGAPPIPDPTDKFVIAGTTMKVTPLLDTPPTVTTIVPVPATAPLGTEAVIVVVVQLDALAATPLNVIVLLPCGPPKPEPVIVTDVPATPDVSDRLLIFGTTVKATPLLATPLTVTTTVPLPPVAPAGTGTVIDVALQIVGVAATPLNVTVLLPCALPNPEPVIVTEVPAIPDVADKLTMLGTTVKATPLLDPPFTVTTTLPVVAAAGTVTAIDVDFQLVGVAATPLNITVLAPCDPPKPVPVIVTAVPTTPEVADSPVITGSAVPVPVSLTV
jgi:hypothetical protein